MFEAARLLTRAGVSVRTAKKVVDSLAIGLTAYAEATSVVDYEIFKKRLMSQNIRVYRIVRRKVDVKALRRHARCRLV